MEPTDEKFQIEREKIKTLFPTETQKYKLKACSQLSIKEAEASPFRPKQAPPKPVMPLSHTTQL